jgi:hypothetical protein
MNEPDAINAAPGPMRRGSAHIKPPMMGAAISPIDLNPVWNPSASLHVHFRAANWSPVTPVPGLHLFLVNIQITLVISSPSIP